MLELLKKVLYAGLGTVAITEQKAREIVSEFEKKGQVTTEEGTQLVKDLVEKGKQRSREMKDDIAEQVQKTVSGLGLASKSDFDELEKKVAELQDRLDSLS